MQQKGRITSWKDDKGFGFITPIGSTKQIFVHIKSFTDRNGRPKLNQVVSYTVSKDKYGRPCAENVSIPKTKPSINTNVKKTEGSSFLSIIFVLMFSVVIFLLVVTRKIPMGMASLYLGASIVTFIIYAIDKLAAKNESRRISENSLHLLSLIGGWPGALVAQYTLRHKSKKQSFRSMFFATVVCNLSILVWLIVSKSTMFT